jgi:tetratricopeptide (TPR) repeat protein
VAAGLATWALAFGVARAEQPAGSNRKEDAARLASEAEALGKKQQFADALTKYKEAAKLDPATAAYQCNIGMAFYALGDEARAHLYFGRCYKQNGGWPESVEAVFNYVVGVLAKKDMTPLKISGTPANAEVVIAVYADEGPLVAPVTVYVPYSNYEILVRADGYAQKKIPVEANARAEKVVSYQLEPSTDSGGGTEPAGADAGAGNNLVGSGGEVEKQAEPGHGRKKWPLLLAGGGVVAAVGGFFAYNAAKDKQDTLYGWTGEDGKILPEYKDQADDVKSEMRLREAVAWSLWGVGAAAIAGGIYLYFSQPAGDADGSMAVGAAPVSGGGMVTFSMTR